MLTFLRNFASIMRKFFCFALLYGLLSVGCREEKVPVELSIKPITFNVESLTVVKLDSSVCAERKKRYDSELDYYLKRHTMRDEGYDMVSRYAVERNTLLVSYVPKTKMNPFGLFRWDVNRRFGYSMINDAVGRIFICSWDGDSIASGVRVDNTGIHGGQFDGNLQTTGHGCFLANDGVYYEGHWQDDALNGFGFCVSTKNLQAGTWRNSRFRGERIRHTNDRIYGIDISRYQHEVGSKRYGINWKNLRVVHLGRRINGDLAVDVNYPVRFVIIKSTQGTTIRSQYFSQDYAAAHKHGIPVGAYHFFSTKKSGRAQADYFLKNTSFRKGDLPPVLDIEPSNAQIRKMGGTEALMKEVRTWIAMVQNRLRVRPILYVNQRFITEHLSKDPYLMDNYLVWIARYGEYKPGVHLAIWQLSADATVSGITPKVDVNVFNGYEPQWEEFLQNESIK